MIRSKQKKKRHEQNRMKMAFKIDNMYLTANSQLDHILTHSPFSNYNIFLTQSLDLVGFGGHTVERLCKNCPHSPGIPLCHEGNKLTLLLIMARVNCLGDIPISSYNLICNHRNDAHWFGDVE